MTEETISKKGLVMLSGGLDSTLAAKMLLEQGVELCGVYLSAPWGCCDKTKALKVAQTLGIEFMVVKLTKQYIEVLRTPDHGYGSSMNPCIDCRIYMFEKAKEVMAQVGAGFLVTGEVLAQRPMSQMRPALTLIEEKADMDGLVLRPLSAKLLPETLPELQGIVDREKLYGIAGRSRKPQMALAEEYGILDYPNPAGGCLLTDKQFGYRVKDLFDHQEDIDLDDMELLRIGRHFRLNPETKLVLGRNEEENMTLPEYLGPGRVFLDPEGFAAPSGLLLGPPDEDVQQLALKILASYTKAEKLPEAPKVKFEPGLPEDSPAQPLVVHMGLPERLDKTTVESMRIG